MDVRAVAATTLAQVYAGRSLNGALPEGLSRVPERDRALLQELCYGSLRLQPQLDAVLAQLLNKPMRDKDRDVHCLLLLGLYQLQAMRVPPHAAVAATVEAVRALKKNWAKGLTNAVLRRFQRERETLLDTLDDAAINAHPAWLHQAICAQWPTQSAAVFACNNQRPPMTLRVNRQRLSRATYLQKLEAAGIEARAGELSPDAIYLAAPTDVQALPGFAAGEVSVQDEAAQLAAHLLAPKPGERILDACAAPGGKSCHLLELEPGIAELVACDVDADRLERVEENLERLELQARVVCADASTSDTALGEAQFDRILIDAPCSASGVIRRHPDVKLLRRAADINALAKQQTAIANQLWQRLRPGGYMLYATCSILEAENSAVVAQLLATQNDAKLAMPAVEWGEAVAAGRQLLPSDSGPDGLFYALLRKAG